MAQAVEAVVQKQPGAVVDDEMTHRRRWVALAVMTLGAFMVLVDTTIVNVAIPSIRSNLGATYADTQWVVAGYQLAYAIMLVTGGRLGDILGRRRLFMIGVVGFTATSVLGGAAQTPGMLIGARVAQGVGGALLFPQGLSMIQALFPERDRARAFGIFGAAAGLAIVLGPLLGGLIVGDQVGGESWRLVFLVNVPVGAVTLLAAGRFVPETRAPGAHGIDLGGVALISLGLFGVTFPLLEGRDADWAPWIWLCIAGGVTMLLAFATYERRRGRQSLPTLVQVHIFRERAFGIGSVAAFLLFVGIPSWLFTFNLMLQAGLGYTPLHAGLTTLGFSGGVFIGAIMGVRLESRLGGRGVLAMGTLFATAGILGTIGILAARDASVSGATFAPALLAMGIGFGNAAPRLLEVVLGGVGTADAGASSGVLTTVQQVGGALGVAVVGVALFGLLGSTAETTVREYTPQIRAAAVEEFHLPAARLVTFTDGVEHCFVERVHAKDPAATIAGCPSPTPALRSSPLGRVDSEALATTFVRAERTALLINAAVLAFAFLLVMALPRSRRPAPDASAP